MRLSEREGGRERQTDRENMMPHVFSSSYKDDTSPMGFRSYAL